MNCRQANRLLPLWIGRDLADASESEALRGHLAECPDCAGRRSKLQESLDALQSVSTGMVCGEMHVARRPSLWPRLATMLGEVPRRRDQFNGWIPAAAMALAAGAMFAVSIVQFQREMGDADLSVLSSPSVDRNDDRDLFNTDKRFAPSSSRRVLPNGLVKLKQPANNW